MKDNLKISISFNQACKLNNIQKIKLLTCQARKLSIENWEIDALLSLCKSNGWIDKGLALLYEYAGYMDELRILVNERSEILDEVLCLLDSEIITDEQLVIIKVQYISELTAKIIMKLCKWRQLQWTPRPLLFNECTRGTEKVSIQFLLREEAYILFQTMADRIKSNSFLNNFKLTDIMFLLVPYLDYSQFISLKAFDLRDKDNNDSMQSLYLTSREILLIEDRIDSSWKSMNVAAQDLSTDDLSSLYPTLRLPYSKKICHPPTDDLAWFEQAISKYKILCNNISTSSMFLSVTEDSISENKEFKSKLSPTNVGTSRRIAAIINKVKESRKKSEDLPIDSTFVTSHEENQLRRLTTNSYISSSKSKTVAEVSDKLKEVIVNDTIEGVNSEHNTNNTVNTIVKPPRRNLEIHLEIPLKSNNSESENSPSELAELRKRSVTIATVGHVIDPNVTPIIESNRRVTHAGEMHNTTSTPSSLLKFRENSLVLETQDDGYEQNLHQKGEKEVIVGIDLNETMLSIEEDKINDIRVIDTLVDLETDTLASKNDIQSAVDAVENVVIEDVAGVSIIDSNQDLRSRASSYEYIFEENEEYHELMADYPVWNTNNSNNAVRARNRSSSSPAISMNYHSRQPFNSSYPKQHIDTIFENSRNSSFTQKIIRAASRLSNYQDEDSNNGLETLTLQNLGMLDNLSRPFLRSDSKKEFGMIGNVLSRLKINNDTIVQFAARKIIIWWRLISPQKKLKSRMQVRNICKDIVHNIIDSSVLVALARKRRKLKLLRNGACMTIQRYFRRYYHLTLLSDKLTKLNIRRERASTLLKVWCSAILNGVRIYRYISYNKSKKIIKIKSKEKGVKLLARILRYYFNTYALNKKLQFEKAILELNASKSFHLKQMALLKEKENAAIIIQKYFRRHSVILFMLNRNVNKRMMSKISFFFIKCIGRHRAKVKVRRFKAALKIQCLYRGAQIRRKILKIVSSGLRLKTLWKTHKSYMNLKAQLRRLDRPYTLIMHGIRNIQKKSVTSDQMRFKVSAWWHPLLHIVNRNDVDVIINTKQPQLIYSSKFYEFQNANNFNRLSISQGIRKISSIFIPKRNSLVLPSIPSSKSSDLSLQSSRSSQNLGTTKKKSVQILPPIKSRASSVTSVTSIDNRPSTIARQSAMIGRSSFGEEEDEEEDQEDEDDEDDEDDEEEDDERGNGRDSFMINGSSRRSFLLQRMRMHAKDLRNSTLASVTNGTPITRKHSIATITMMASSRNIIGDTPLSSIYKTKAKTFLSRFTVSSSKPEIPELQREDSNLICNFEDNTIKIPGCHGNSVIKLDIYDGERLFGYHIFYMNREGEMMYWGGEYSKKIILQKEQRRIVQGKIQKDNDNFSDDPILDFRINAGAPLRAKCSWGRLAVRGNGPMKRLLKARRFFSSFIFDKWHRFYFSLDENGLSLFDNKFNTFAAHLIPLKDFKEVSVDIGAPIRESSMEAAKNVVEDIHNVKLVTFTGDEVYMRFPDALTRIEWQEVLCNAISFHTYNKKQQAKNHKYQKPWKYLNSLDESIYYSKNSGILATAVIFNEQKVTSSGKYFGLFSNSAKTVHYSSDEDESIDKDNRTMKMMITTTSQKQSVQLVEPPVRLSILENRRVINSSRNLK